MTARLLVYLDHLEGTITSASWEALGAGKALAEELQVALEAVVVGDDCMAAAEAAASLGVGLVRAASHPGLKDFHACAYADVLAPLAEGAEAVIFPDNGRTRELAAILAVDLEAGLIPDVIALSVEEGTILARRAIYSGKVHSSVRSSGKKPILLTLRNRAFPALKEGSSAGKVETLEVADPDADVEVLGYERTTAGVSLADAAVIVAGGRGVTGNVNLEPPGELSSPEEIEAWKAAAAFAQLQELADALGAALGATRAVVDAGYIEYAHQIGQTGKVVTPDLYFAFGISGAIQHLAGIRSARTVVAVNKDPEAPIFRSARFGIIGDMHRVVPALLDALKE